MIFQKELPIIDNHFYIPLVYNITELSFSLLWQILKKNNFKEERIILIHGFRGSEISAHGQLTPLFLGHDKVERHGIKVW
jgi:hypothetical protein